MTSIMFDVTSIMFDVTSTMYYIVGVGGADNSALNMGKRSCRLGFNLSPHIFPPDYLLV